MIKNAKRQEPETVKVSVRRDEQAGVFVVTKSDIEGLATEHETLEGLRQKLPAMIVDLVGEQAAGNMVLEIEIEPTPTKTDLAVVPNILDIDAASFAGAVAHAAAARFANIVLLDRPADFWFMSTFASEINADAAEVIIAALASYVCSRPDRVAGETLFRKAVELGHVPGQWADLGMVERNVWCLFAQTCWNVHQDVTLMQRLERDKREAAAVAPSAPVPDEDDDAFAVHGRMDEQENLDGKPKKRGGKPSAKPKKK